MRARHAWWVLMVMVSVNCDPDDGTPGGDHTLEVQKEGEGRVVSSPDGIDCGEGCELERATFADGVEVSLTPTAAPGWQFDRWLTDTDCADGKVTMDGTVVCTAVFVEASATWSRRFVGLGSGRVSAVGVGDDVLVAGSQSTGAWLFKLDVDGEPMWRRELEGGTAHEAIYPGLTVLRSGDVALATVRDQGAGAGVHLSLLDADGEVQWDRRLSRGSEDRVGVVEFESGAIAVSQSISLTMIVNSQGELLEQASHLALVAGQNYAFIGLAESFLWTADIGPVYRVAHDLTTDLQGELYKERTRDQGMRFETAVESATGVLLAGATEMGLDLRAEDDAGDLLWEKRYEMSGRDDGTAIVSIAGGSVVAFLSQEREPTVLRLTELGEPLWARRYGIGEEAARLDALVATSDGGYVVMGSYVASDDLWVLKVDGAGQSICSSEEAPLTTVDFDPFLSDAGLLPEDVALTLTETVLSTAEVSTASTGLCAVGTNATLTLTVTGQGTVTSDPAGIDCGDTCSAEFPVGTEVEIIGTPSEGWQFIGLRGGVGCANRTFTLTADVECEAMFTRRIGIPPGDGGAGGATDDGGAGGMDSSGGTSGNAGSGGGGGMSGSGGASGSGGMSGGMSGSGGASGSGQGLSTWARLLPPAVGSGGSSSVGGSGGGGGAAGFTQDFEARLLEPTSDGGYIAVVEPALSTAQSPLVTKLDSSGALVWTRRYGFDTVSVTDIAEVSGGADGYAIAGTVFNLDAEVVRTDRDGAVLWERELSFNNLSRKPRSIESLSGGELLILLAGRASDFSETASLVRLNASGDIVSARRYGGSSDFVPSMLRKARDGGFLLVGTAGLIGSQLGWLAKLDATLGMTWQRTFDDLNDIVGQDVVSTSDGGYLVTARLSSSTVAGGTRAILVKLDATGAIVWQKAYQSALFLPPNAIMSALETSDGYVVLVHGTELLKVNRTGEPVWKRTYAPRAGLLTLGLNVAAVAADGFTIAGWVRDGTTPTRGWLLRVGADGSVGSNCAPIGNSVSVMDIATDTSVTSASVAPWQEDLALGTAIDTTYGATSPAFDGALVCGG